MAPSPAVAIYDRFIDIDQARWAEGTASFLLECHDAVTIVKEACPRREVDEEDRVVFSVSQLVPHSEFLHTFYYPVSYHSSRLQVCTHPASFHVYCPQRHGYDIASGWDKGMHGAGTAGVLDWHSAFFFAPYSLRLTLSFASSKQQNTSSRHPYLKCIVNYSKEVAS